MLGCSSMARNWRSRPSISSTEEFMFSQSMRYLFIVSLVLAAATPGFATSDDRGTVGINFAQLFDDTLLPRHRGPLVVLQVMEESAAAKAGIYSGDFVI